jgi:hypothetical protein
MSVVAAGGNEPQAGDFSPPFVLVVDGDGVVVDKDSACELAAAMPT